MIKRIFLFLKQKNRANDSENSISNMTPEEIYQAFDYDDDKPWLWKDHEISINKDNCPSRCTTWSSEPKELDQYKFTASEVIWDDSHDTFSLYRCQACKTFYLWHWHEEIDWDDSNDSATTVVRSLPEADLVAIRYMLATSPSSMKFKRFLEALV